MNGLKVGDIMIEIFIKNLLEKSLLGSIGIILIIAFRKPLLKKYTNAFNYYIWLAVISKMIIPFKIPINIPERMYNSFEYSPNSVKAILNNGISINQGTEIKNSVNKIYVNNSITNFFTIIFYLWLIISVFFLVYHIISYYNYNKKIKDFTYDVLNNEIKEMYSNLLTELNIKKRISLKFCKGISTPFGIGIFNCRILIPDVSYDIKELEYILRHELMHYKRFDIMYKILLLVTMAIHWFNPLVYIMYKEINNYCELSCDEAILKSSSIEERKLYALTLVNSLRLNKNNIIKQNLIMEFNNKYILKRRLENMLNLKLKRKGLILGVLVLVITASSLVTMRIFAQNDINKTTAITTINPQSLSSKQVLENYFKYCNEKNVDGISSLMTEWRKPSGELDENLESIKLNSITEDTRPSQKEAYMKYGHGIVTGTKEENISIYKVKYTVKYKKDGIGPEDSGTYEKSYILIRKDKNSPWLIDDGGEG